MRIRNINVNGVCCQKKDTYRRLNCGYNGLKLPILQVWQDKAPYWNGRTDVCAVIFYALDTFLHHSHTDSFPEASLRFSDGCK